MKKGAMTGYTVEFMHPTRHTLTTREIPYGHEIRYVKKMKPHLPMPQGAGPDGAARSNPYFITKEDEAAGAPKPEPRRSGLPRPLRGGAGGPRY
jgi:hypothetical protein